MSSHHPGLLQGKTALITGASSGIGYETAKLFARQGAKLIVGARRAKLLDQLVTDITSLGGTAIALAGDVTQENYARDLVDLACDSYGGLDIAFNNAGILGEDIAVGDKDLTAWHHEIDTNLTSAFLAAKYQIPALSRQQVDQQSKSLIFTSSFVGYSAGMPHKIGYAAAKAGLIGLTKALAIEASPRNIRVNAILPGGTETPMADAFGDDPAVRQFVENMHALKRLAQPAEIAQSVLYLASDMSSFTTGTAMLVDGGVSICKT